MPFYQMLESSVLKEFNQNHDAKGEFSSGDGGSHEKVEKMFRSLGKTKLEGEVGDQTFRFKSGIDDKGERYVKIHKGASRTQYHALPVEHFKQWADEHVKNLREH